MVDSNIVTALISALTNKFENKSANKKDNISGDFTGDNVSYPTVKAVKNFFGNKITSWSGTPSDSNYPSEKLVKSSLDDKISKSSTNGLIKNDGTVDTNDYATSSSLPTKTSDLVNDGEGDDGVKFVLSDDAKLTDSRTPKSHTHGDISNDGKLGSTANKPLITTTGGKINVGSFGSGANTFCEGNDSRLSDARTPTAHNQGTNTITNIIALDNILAGESIELTLDTQEKINSAINDKLGALSRVEFIKVVTDKGTASASTMNKLYIEVGQNKTDIYYTSESSGTYRWNKLEEDILDDISISWEDIQNKPSSYTPSSHSHGNISNDGKVGSASGKPLITTTNGAVTAGAFGTSAGQFAEGNHGHSNYTTISDVDSEVEAYIVAITNALNS
jgi:hypothetical protein